MPKPVRPPAALATLAVVAALLAPRIAAADDGYPLAVSAAHKLKVFADGGAAWCGPHLKLRMVLEPGSPDAGNPAAQADLLNRLKGPITADCAAATDGEVAVFLQNKLQGSFKASKAGGWSFAAPAAPVAARQPASLDDAPAAPAAVVSAAPAAAPAAPPPRTMPGDVPGSHDPAFLKRYEGSTIVSYKARPFDRYHLFIADPKDPKLAIRSDIEGQVTRIFYKTGPGHTVLELLRNYQHALDEAGFSQLYATDDRSFFNLSDLVYKQTFQITDNGYFWNGLVQEMAYVTAEATQGGNAITVAVFVFDYRAPNELTYDGKKMTISPGEITVVVDVVTAKAVEIKMVAVKASDIAEGLATKGSFDLYGILFDTDKTEIKPESSKALDEVASVLKIDRSLRLEISGHTDNTGSAEHNQKLSEGRAAAVVAALVKTYGIDPARLEAKGYGDSKPVAANDSDANKAKNRRVELRKL